MSKLNEIGTAIPTNVFVHTMNTTNERTNENIINEVKCRAKVKENRDADKMSTEKNAFALSHVGCERRNSNGFASHWTCF